MSKKLLIAWLAGWVMHVSSLAGAQDPLLPPGAEEVCQGLFQMLDEGRLRETYRLTAPVVRGTESETAWHGQMRSERESLGEVRSRSLSRVERLERFADLPEGDYILAVYDTAFSAHPESQELVVLAAMEGADYALAAYRVRYDMWPEAIEIIQNGLALVFFIMGLLAATTWTVGKIVQAATKDQSTEDDAKKR